MITENQSHVKRHFANIIVVVEYQYLQSRPTGHRPSVVGAVLITALQMQPMSVNMSSGVYRAWCPGGLQLVIRKLPKACM